MGLLRRWAASVAERRPDPETPSEWQDAVDGAHAALALHAAHEYGLIARVEYGGPRDGMEIGDAGVNVERCEEILIRGAEMGYTPSEDAIERFVSELASE
jgi:hypothetical protein